MVGGAFLLRLIACFIFSCSLKPASALHNFVPDCSSAMSIILSTLLLVASASR